MAESGTIRNPLRALRTMWSWAAPRRRRLVALFVTAMHVAGAVLSIHSVMATRTPQGAVAWVVSLNTFPYVAVPAYLIFGHSRFDGYELLRHRDYLAGSPTESRAMRALREGGLVFEPDSSTSELRARLLERLALLPLTRGNDVDLLVDGEATFDAIEASIRSAEDYVLFQFYILRSDGLGQRLKAALLDRAAAGVRCYVLYDQIGSAKLDRGFVKELNDGGVQTATFRTTRGLRNRFRVNFRNHRKIVVVDGREAFVGGHNVGDEYLGLDPKLGPFRDTHVAVRGPVVLAAQVTFVEDWSWTTGDVPDLDWIPRRAPEGDAIAACVPTGPADELETMTLVFLDLLQNARSRVWIATPYFVPDAQIVSALQIAAVRGVDVRVIVPDNNDNPIVDLTSYSYLEELARAGVRMYRYEPGFMHQKVMLVDEIASIGTANFDNRSMRLNFEISMLLHDDELIAEVVEMLEADLARSRPFEPTEYTERGIAFRAAVRLSRLLAPVL
ncbi:MAG: cardiolipin synthase [Planctomycetota bacterium]